VVLNGFVDDSGTGHGKVSVLAGFLSTSDRWKQFSNGLEELCRQEPRTPDFKMEKASSFRAYHWATRESLNKRIEDVASLIQTHAMYRVDAVVSREAYQALVEGKVPRKIDSPYFVLFYTVILSSAAFVNKASLGGTVDFIFDEQGKIGKRAGNWYQFIKERVRPEIRNRLGCEPDFRHDSELLPLKAADLLAWQIRRHLDLEQPRGNEHNKIVDQILAKILGVSCHVHPEHLKAFVANIGHGLMLKADCRYHIPKQEVVESRTQ